MRVPFRVKDDIYIYINNEKRKKYIVLNVRQGISHLPGKSLQLILNIRTLKTVRMLKLILNLVLKNCTKLIPGCTRILMKGDLWCKV